MINLFNINNYNIDTSKFNNMLHGSIVSDFENEFCSYVGAKYACSLNSATNAIFLSLLNKNITVNVPSIIPPVVLNAIITSGNKINFIDNIEWVGHSYTLHQFDDYKIIDSAQRVDRNQFKNEAHDKDLMIFSFYPTKPVGSCDGGIIVSNDIDKIIYFKEMAMNGMSFAENNWDRKIKMPGFKMYMNSIQAYIALNNLRLLDHKKCIINELRNKYNSKLGLSNTSDHLYRISVDDNNKFIQYAKNNGIICGKHYSAMHQCSVYNNTKVFLPLSDIVNNTTVSIPMHECISYTEVNQIIDTIYEYNKF